MMPFLIVLASWVGAMLMSLNLNIVATILKTRTENGLYFSQDKLLILSYLLF